MTALNTIRFALDCPMSLTLMPLPCAQDMKAAENQAESPQTRTFPFLSAQLLAC